MEISHIVNTLDPTGTHLDTAQSITLQSMVEAKDRAPHDVNVRLLSCSHINEEVNLPNEFEEVEHLTRYAHESLPDLPDGKNLPVLRDILARGMGHTNSEYYIYSNIDISLYSNFYEEVSNYIKNGYESICLNRKTLPEFVNDEPVTVSNYKHVLSQSGTHHGGADCFVFASHASNELWRLGDLFLGYPPIGAVTVEWIRDISKNFLWVKDKVCTFHIGDDRPWAKKTIYNKVNEKIGKKVYPNYPKTWKRYADIA